MSEWTQESVLGLARSFMQARILLTAAELGLFDLVADEAQSVEQVTERLQGDARATAILLDALVAMGLLAKEAGRYIAAPGTASILTVHGERSVLPMLLHSAGMWERWSDLTRKVREQGGGSGALGSDEARTAAFIGAMHVVGGAVAPRVVEAIGPGDARRFLDVGGASGTYTIAFLQASPRLRATLFDRASVIPMAEDRLSRSGLLDRVTLVPGDFYTDQLPPGHDLVLLSAIIHQNSREQNVDLYRKCLEACVSGGRLVVRDHVMSEDRTQPALGALFAVNMLVATPGGGTYTYGEIREDLQIAGFERVKLLQADERMNGLVEAFRP